MKATPFPGHAAPAAGFEVPLEMLAACHGRIEAQCGTLRRLGPHLAAQGADTQAREAAQALVRYFDTAAPDHHADEEQDLFPALLEAMAGSDAVCLREMTAALAQEHRVLERQWQALRAVLLQVAAGDAAGWSAEAAETFIGLYERHIAREDGELLPMAARLLGTAELERIGRAMRLRRERR
ncbi:MAG: hemerythrin domain-containing protein [Burkholderiales bacterium]|nr:hemerythrin domain-containing protein [Burkholderiales bacterium]